MNSKSSQAGPHQAGGLRLNHCVPLSEKRAHASPAWTLPRARPVSEEPFPLPWNGLLTPLSLFRAPLDHHLLRGPSGPPHPK